MKRLATALAVAAGATVLAAAPANADPTPSPAVTPSPSPSPSVSPSPLAPAHPPKPSYHPDPKILGVYVSPNPVVVRWHGSSEVTASVRTKDARVVSIELWGPRGGGHFGGGHWEARKGWPGDHDGPRFDSASRSWRIDWNDRTGYWKVHVEAVGADGKRLSADQGFVVKHQPVPPRPRGPKATRIAGFDATPEPVRKGRSLTLKGELQVAQCYSDWYYRPNDYVSVHGGPANCHDNQSYWHDWHWLGGQEIGVYFLPAGSHKWKYVKTLGTDGDGDFSTRVKAVSSGTWGVRYAGNGRLKASEAYDYVKVVRH
ncbi:hypothetical protein JOL79_07330 [Microbispora sp. RL4-1S]|uniref:Uncharacterized protein n=1 Tax=Microbispora oryzae TaxID=2806554 RepID=A0A940WDN7_9ACTN|nr:hypothetical protein [Microbispora oryzae]MBP2703610.1 hypothetical protein [Microbispora oryzae]